MTLDERSIEWLSEVHPDLQLVVYRCAEIFDLEFVVTEGIRSAEHQRQLIDIGASQNMNSRHLTGHAVDLAVLFDEEFRLDWPLYHKLAAAMKEAARIEAVPIEWGGDWLKFKDGPHFQLPWSVYR